MHKKSEILISIVLISMFLPWFMISGLSGESSTRPEVIYIGEVADGTYIKADENYLLRWVLRSESPAMYMIFVNDTAIMKPEPYKQNQIVEYDLYVWSYDWGKTFKIECWASNLMGEETASAVFLYAISEPKERGSVVGSMGNFIQGIPLGFWYLTLIPFTLIVIGWRLEPLWYNVGYWIKRRVLLGNWMPETIQKPKRVRRGTKVLVRVKRSGSSSSLDTPDEERRIIRFFGHISSNVKSLVTLLRNAMVSVSSRVFKLLKRLKRF